MNNLPSRLLSLTLALVFTESVYAQHQHVIVYREKGRFGGWPANHGAWVWGNELLVGFSRGYHKDLGSKRHNIDRDKPEEFLLARSLDAGHTWKLEFPNRKGQLLPRGKSLHGTELPGVKLQPLSPIRSPIQFKHPDFALTLRMNDVDGAQSRLSYSYDRGRTWKGPFRLPNMSTQGIAARTDYLIDGENTATLMLTAAKEDGEEGRVFCGRTNDGGKTFQFVSWVNDEVPGYEIMPSTVRISTTHLVTTTRVRQPRGGASWIDAYSSKDNGKTWEYLCRPVPDTGAGNPPSLIRLKDGRLCLTYGYRARPFEMRARLSIDHGATWSKPILLRTGGGGTDMGYPRTLQTMSGRLVTIYYFWTKKSGPERFIAATLWNPPSKQNQ